MNYNNCYSSMRPCYGPSPLIPFLIILGLLLVIFWDGLCEWYEYACEVKGSIESNVPLLIFVTFLLLIFLLGFINDPVAVLISLAIILIVLPFLNDITVVLVLLVVVAFLGIYYYPQQKSVYYPGKLDSYGRNEPGFGLSSSLLCYVIMLSCLFICITYYEGEDSRWICLALVLVCVLFFNFSSFGDGRSTYPVKKTGSYGWNWNWLRSSYQPRNVGSYDGRGYDPEFGLSLGWFSYIVMLVCIFFCMVFCDNNAYWCFSFALGLLIVLYFNYSEPQVMNRA